MTFAQEYHKGTDGRLYRKRSDGKWVPAVSTGGAPGPAKGAGPTIGAVNNTPAAGPAPFDYAAEARRISGENNRKTALGDLNVDIQGEASQAGFKFDPATGAFGGIDPSNPFSRAMLLQKSYEQGQQQSTLGRDRGLAGNTTSFAARGQGYSGALINAQDEQQRLFSERDKSLKQGYDTGYDTLRRGFDDYVKRWQRRKRDVENSSADTLAGSSFPG